MQTSSAVIVSDLVTGYRNGRREVKVSHAFSASLPSGSLTCLIGRNGAGKSTVLKTLCGFIPPLEGSVQILGRGLNTYSPSELARTVGVVLTERTLATAMTVTEVVALGRAPYTGFWGSLSADDRRIVDECLELTGITDLSSRLTSTLSDGERQKVMIAKALAQQTPLILLDEPTAFLDYPSKVELLQLLKKLSREEGKTIFLSTHDLEITFQLADNLWMLDRNLGFRAGSPEALSADGSIARYFERRGLCYLPASLTFKIIDE